MNFLVEGSKILPGGREVPTKEHAAMDEDAHEFLLTVTRLSWNHTICGTISTQMLCGTCSTYRTTHSMVPCETSCGKNKFVGVLVSNRFGSGNPAQSHGWFFHPCKLEKYIEIIWTGRKNADCLFCQWILDLKLGFVFSRPSTAAFRFSWFDQGETYLPGCFFVMEL